jgi:3-deoxy-D-manno-octulosonic-acid transferase
VLLNLCYLLALIVSLPWLLYRRVVLKKDREGWGQKFFGLVPQNGSATGAIWFHAVSVGEVLLLKPLIEQTQKNWPDRPIVVSTGTGTGQAVAKQQYPAALVCYFPFDFTWAVKTAIRRLKPALIVLVELEVWPNLIREAARLHIPLMIANGRLSAKSYTGYRRLMPLIRPVLHQCSHIAVQNEEYRERFLLLGAKSSQLTITGNLKFDKVITSRQDPAVQELRTYFGLGPDNIVLVAGSTQSPEEEYAICIWQTLHSSYPALRLIVVPRHQERFAEVASLITRMTGSVHTRSCQQPGSISDAPRVALLDTLGELGRCWGLADIAFVGGSLSKRGGQNMLEPAGFGAAISFGPNTQNFREITTALLQQNAAVAVRDEAELLTQVKNWLDDPASREQFGQRAQAFVATQTGATHRTIEVMLRLLPADAQIVAR